MTPEQLEQFIRKKTDEIREHVDSVMVLVTVEAEDGSSETVDIACGAGNTMAIYGHLKSYLLRSDERSKVRLRRQLEEQEEDDEDYGEEKV